MSRSAGIALLCALLACIAASPATAADRPKPGSVYRDGPSGRYLLDGTWYHRADPTDVGLAQHLQQQESLAGWATTTVPNASNAGDFSNQSYMGNVHWYRKDFRLPRAAEASKWMLRFESVNYRARVWLNGKPIGLHVGAYLPFELRAKSVRRRGVNRLVVRVDSRRQKFDIPPLSQRASGAFEGGWWNYNGILREVYLRRVDQFDFAHVAYLPSLRCRTCAATVKVEVTVRNVNSKGAAARITGSIGGKNLRFRGHRVSGGGERSFRARVRIRNPRLWSPERPALYTGRLQLRTSGGRIVQKHRVHTGIRTFRVSRLGRIQLNFRDVNREREHHSEHSHQDLGGRQIPQGPRARETVAGRHGLDQEPPEGHSRGEERRVLERVRPRVVEGELVHRRDVPQPHQADIEGERDRRVCERAEPLLDRPQAAHGRA
jgi:beta-glucuronidase